MIGIYVRVSSEEQKKFGHSISGQIQRNIRYCEEFFPDEKYTIYTDPGISASNMKKRIEFKKLIYDIEQGSIDRIICTDLDRIHRDLMMSENFFIFLEDHNVKLICIENDIARETPEQILFSRIKSSISEFEIQKTSERTINCMVAAFEKGKIGVGGKPPFGFKRNESNEFVIDKEKQKICLSICKLYTETTLAINSIKDVIFEEYRVRLHKETISNILFSNIYRGVYTYRDIDYTIPTIIEDVTLYNKIESRKIINSKVKSNLYLFNNKLICASCGATLKNDCTNKPNKTYIYYKCMNKSCEDYDKRVNEDKVYMRLHKTVQETFEKDIQHKFNEDYQLTSIKKLIKQKEAKYKRLIKLYLDNSIDEELYQVQLKLINSELNVLRARYDETLESFSFDRALKEIAIEKHFPKTEIKL